jgi:hypothetical protein
MTKYLLGYHGSFMTEAPDPNDSTMAAWGAWMEGMGKALVDGGHPARMAKTVAAGGKVSSGGGANPITGYTIIEAETIDDAVELSKGCPIFKAGGSIEVSELVAM